MTALISHLGGNFFSRYLSQEAGQVLPRRIKRLIYVSSAMGLLLKTRELDARLAERINSTMKLAYGASGLLFPVYIGAIIWKNLKTNLVELKLGPVQLTSIDVYKLDDMDCWRTGLFFARNVPTWLRYGTIELMTADIHDMLVELERAKAA